MITLRFTLLFLMLTSSFAFVRAQVLNIDRELGQDSAHIGHNLFTSLTLSSDKQKKKLINVSGALEYDKFLKNRYLFVALVRNEGVFNGSEMIQNEGLVHLRFRDNDSRKWSPELFTQCQWNGAWGLKYRNLAGANLRIRIFDKEKHDMYAGVGGFYEMERWNWTGVEDALVPPDATDVIRSLWRMNTYLKMSVKLSNTVDFSSTSFIQFPIDHSFLKPRWYMESNLFINASKRIEFVLHWDHIVDPYRAVPIENFYYSFSMGLQVRI